MSFNNYISDNRYFYGVFGFSLLAFVLFFGSTGPEVETVDVVIPDLSQTTSDDAPVGITAEKIIPHTEDDAEEMDVTAETPNG